MLWGWVPLQFKNGSLSAIWNWISLYLRKGPGRLARPSAISTPGKGLVDIIINNGKFS